MATPVELDDKTLAILVTLSDLTGQSHSIRHIIDVFNRSVAQLQEYRTDPEKPYTYNGF
jgi:hypothetical protein